MTRAEWYRGWVVDIKGRYGVRTPMYLATIACNHAGDVCYELVKHAHSNWVLRKRYRGPRGGCKGHTPKANATHYDVYKVKRR